MRKSSAVALLAAALMAAGCAGTKTGTATPPAPAATAAAGKPAPAPVQTAAAVDPNDPDPIICQKEPDSTSRLKRNKVCMHKSEWEARAEQDQDALGEARGVNINPSGGD